MLNEMGVIPTRMFPLGVGHGAPLPYDAEVEYLEAAPTAADTGPFINTLIVPSTTARAEIDWTPVKYATSAEPYGFGVAGFNPGSGANTRFVAGLTSQSSPTLYWGVSNLNIYNSVQWSSGNRLTQFIQLNGTTATYGYETTSYQTSISLYNNTTSPILLFARAAGYPAWHAEMKANSKSRIYSCKIWQTYADGVSRDFIPVRVGTTGYLYDRANPTGGPNGNGLYGNAGTGSFTLGPDKT